MQVRSSNPFVAGCQLLAMSLAVTCGAGNAFAQAIVPGTGTKVTEVGDDFEDVNWAYHFGGAKSSSNIDHRERQPCGISTNRRWQESLYRGQPDVIERIETPLGGIEGSHGALLMRTLHSGIPGTLTREMQQDDLLVSVRPRLGRNIAVSRIPNVVVRVFMPPFEHWEQRTGASFGFRAELQTTKITKKRGLFSRRTKREIEPYWPGMFIQYNRKATTGKEHDSATILVRSDNRGQDSFGPTIEESGWWTMGMSFTPDGRVHYYASPGVDDLKASDHIASSYPYGYRAEHFNTFFFNIVNQDNGRSWSTEWVIDDPELYLVR